MNKAHWRFFEFAYVSRFVSVDFPEQELKFKELLQEYLFSPEGRTHLQDIKVEGSVVDLEGNFNITVRFFF